MDIEKGKLYNITLDSQKEIDFLKAMCWAYLDYDKNDNNRELAELILDKLT